MCRLYAFGQDISPTTWNIVSLPLSLFIPALFIFRSHSKPYPMALNSIYRLITPKSLSPTSPNLLNSIPLPSCLLDISWGCYLKHLKVNSWSLQNYYSSSKYVHITSNQSLSCSRQISGNYSGCALLSQSPPQTIPKSNKDTILKAGDVRNALWRLKTMLQQFFKWSPTDTLGWTILWGVRASSIPTPGVTSKSVSRHCQVSPGIVGGRRPSTLVENQCSTTGRKTPE